MSRPDVFPAQVNPYPSLPFTGLSNRECLEPLDSKTRKIFETHAQLLKSLTENAKQFRQELNLSFPKFIRQVYQLTACQSNYFLTSPQSTTSFTRTFRRSHKQALPGSFESTTYVIPTQHLLEIFPYETVYHETSSVALETLSQGRPLQPPLVLEQTRLTTHKGPVLSLIIDFLENVARQNTGEMAAFCWTSPLIDAEHLFFIEKSAVTDPEEKQKQIKRLPGLITMLLNAESEKDKERAIESIRQLLFDIYCLRGWFYRNLVPKLKEVINSEDGRFILESFLHRLKTALKKELTFPQDYTAIVLELDWEELLSTTAVNGFNFTAFRPNGGSLRIPPTPVIPSDCVRAIYTPQRELVTSYSELPVHPTSALGRECWINNTPLNQIEGINPEVTHCDLRYSDRIPFNKVAANAAWALRPQDPIPRYSEIGLQYQETLIGFLSGDPHLQMHLTRWEQLLYLNMFGNLNVEGVFG
ncbi:MAG: hypothetical protein GF381_02115 [Candidatus Pacebacteria bacterium]|nr:hypothetical protein [Candidatus Paceibacterota bacterium]